MASTLQFKPEDRADCKGRADGFGGADAKAEPRPKNAKKISTAAANPLEAPARDDRKVSAATAAAMAAVAAAAATATAKLCAAHDDIQDIEEEEDALRLFTRDLVLEASGDGRLDNAVRDVGDHRSLSNFDFFDCRG